MSSSPARLLTNRRGEPLKIVLADDHEVVRKGLCLLLEKEFGVHVVEAPSAHDAVAWAREPSVDLVVLDIRMPQKDGLAALEEIRKARKDVPVLMLSTFEDPECVQKAIALGANGFLLKGGNTNQLAEAIETAIHGGGLYLHPSVAHRVFRLQQTGNGPGEHLSERERAVLRRVAEGATNETIAGELYVSEKTVKSHLSAVFRKLDVRNRTEAAAKAIREGLVPLPDRERALTG